MDHANTKSRQRDINPITRMDYPDPDVIRVGDTYYMVSTTMYYMPGCEILRSYDLVHWEHAAYVYDLLDSTPAQRLEGAENIYGQGMWAASLRNHNGTFYICFVANDTHKTYLYRAESIEGPWEKSEIEGFYHDNSILFDDDGRVYIVYGNREIYLTELRDDLSGPKPGGLHRLILTDRDDAFLGYEGSHFYKINGRYYIFFIHMPKATGRRTEACFSAASLTDEFVGGDVFDDDRGYFNSGCAQGGIVETPGGAWYAIVFQDSGAVGRIPILVPVTWKGGMPVFGENGVLPAKFPIEDLKPDHVYEPLVSNDDFRSVCPEILSTPGADGPVEIDFVNHKRRFDTFAFKSCWQFNHEPDLSLITRDTEVGTVTVTTDKVCKNLVQAKNVLTQRTTCPSCAAEITVDGAALKEGDYAGLCLLESSYAFAAITRRDGELYVVMQNRVIDNGSFWGERKDNEPGTELACIKLSGSSVRLRAEALFENKADTGRFFYYDGEEKKALGPESKLVFKLDHFTGVRFGLFVFSTKQTGGRGTFSEFIYE